MVLALAVAQTVGLAQSPASVGDALVAYAHGDYARAVDWISRASSARDDFFPDFARQAERWVQTPGATSPQHRALVAATVALEIAHLLRGQPADRGGRYLLWASNVERKSVDRVPSPAEHEWCLATMAAMEELSEPWVLTTGAVTGSIKLKPLRDQMGAGGHVSYALTRFPEDSRFLLAQVEAREYQPEGAWLVPVLTPAVQTYLHAKAEARVPDTSTAPGVQNALGDRLMAERNLAHFARLPEVIQAYLALASHEDLRGEIDLRTGYLYFSLGRWTHALDHLQSVQSLTDETALRYLDEYFIGRTYQLAGDHTRAIDAFERAAGIVPQARSAVTQLAAELFLTDRVADRDRVYPLLHAAYVENNADDPWQLYAHGDARLWPRYMARLREALQ
jgi:hypothetical protein